MAVSGLSCPNPRLAQRSSGCAHNLGIAPEGFRRKVTEAIEDFRAIGPQRHVEVYLTTAVSRHASYLFTRQAVKAAYVFTAAKDNQPGLVAKLDALPWQNVPAQRRGRKNSLTSATRRSGASMAAKCPPRSNSVQCTMLCWDSAMLLMVMSMGKTATPVGTADGSFGCPQLLAPS